MSRYDTAGHVRRQQAERVGWQQPLEILAADPWRTVRAVLLGVAVVVVLLAILVIGAR
jgi:hypothetical protein